MTRRAASPYFSLTTSLTSIWTFLLLLAELEDGLRLNRLVAGAAFGIEEAEQLPQRVGVGRIPEIGAFPAYLHEVFVLELVEVMRERGGRNVQLRAHVAGDHALRMRREQQPHDAKAWLRSHCGKHIRIPHHIGFRFRFCHQSHSSSSKASSEQSRQPFSDCLWSSSKAVSVRTDSLKESGASIPRFIFLQL